jgi:hypothetical protein
LGKKTSTSKTSNKPWKAARPHLLGAMNTISNTVNSNQGNLDAMAGDLRGFLPGLGEKAFGANPALDGAMGYASDAIGGKFLDQQNPYMQGMIDSTSDDVSDRVNSLFANSGASLGTQHAGVLSKELASAQNNLRYGNYAQERQLQQGAAGMMPSLNAAQYSGVMPYLAATQGAAGLPYTGIQNLGMIGGLSGGYGTSSQTQPGGWGNALLGAAGAAAPFIFSDRRLKKNIEQIGEYPNGLGKYRWVYRSDPSETVCEGVMADEVKARFPHAYREDARGYGMVNYAALEAA